MDPKLHKNIPPGLKVPAQAAVVHAVLYVFAAMLVFAVAQLIVSRLIYNKKHDHAVTREESFESLGG